MKRSVDFNIAVLVQNATAFPLLMICAGTRACSRCFQVHLPTNAFYRCPITPKPFCGLLLG